MLFSLFFSNLAWYLAFKHSINVEETKDRRKEGREGRRKERAVHVEGSCRKKNKLEQDSEGIDHDSIGSVVFLNKCE